MSELRAPSPELAERLLAERESYEDRLTGWKAGSSTGNTQVSLYSLQEVADFLQMSDPGSLLQRGNHAFIGFVDLGQLQGWVREKLGDVELAEAIEAQVATGPSYADRIGPIRELMEARLEQAKAALA